MANISSYLAAIMSAVYGEDVRGSIHDAIEIINDVSEVVLSTGTAVTSSTSSSTGFYDGSFYINTNTMELWKCIGTDSWQSQGTLKGADGNGIASITKTGTAGLVDTYTITYDDGNTTTFTVTNGEDGQNGSKWYKGTAIAGTGTSITGFPGVKDDYYLNSSNGNVYVCTKTGGASVPDPAEWDYVMTLVGGGGGSSINVIDTLTSTSSTDALSANQGRVLKGLVDGKASNDPTFTMAASRVNIVSGETLSVLFGKISKWFNDLKTVAFTGDYNDLSVNKPDLTVYQTKTMSSSIIVDSHASDKVETVMGNLNTYKKNISDADSWFGTSATVSAGTVSFSDINDLNNYGYELYIQVTGSSTNKNPTAQISSISGTGTSQMSISFTTDADNGATAKLRIIK